MINSLAAIVVWDVSVSSMSIGVDVARNGL